MLPGPHHNIDLVYLLLAPLSANKEGSKSRMVLRVKHTPTRFPKEKSLYADEQHTLAFYIKLLAYLREAIFSTRAGTSGLLL